MVTIGEPLVQLIGWCIQALEMLGVAVIIGGFVFAAARWPFELRAGTGHQAYLAFRMHSVRGLILGLEFLVAADIIRTIAIEYTFESLMMLGAMVLIRTFLVFALHLEVEGRWPWRAGPEGAETPPRPRD
ncbi:DUF1622 domain-containing protein [Luteimonas sp. RD2P54]|uniref:DUF1622 domain-containing protein n=1 Tax=Luteimonas endophytica TaxID=3042023 RepID=A0ABT6J9L7_9GAMM|nr:DUF1622 domain-containing protein [Luteimonas endophytica]MDH5823525.1 DUF1622 domain-containing protein [Luteimonas endophytica]